MLKRLLSNHFLLTFLSFIMASHDDTEDVALNFGEEEEMANNKTVRHPVAVFFHLAFRVAAMLTYLLCGWFGAGFISSFVVIITFMSMDFWTVKNITGRLLVGLRWWNYVDEDGKSHWLYESHKGAKKQLVTNTESRIFWLSIVVFQVIWIVLLFGTIVSFSLKWFMVVLIGNILNGANLFGYVRCKIGAKKKLSAVATSFLGQQVFRSMLSSLSKREETKKESDPVDNV